MIPGANCLVLANSVAELALSLDYGPRILGYRLTGHENVFKTFPEQLPGGGEPKWMIRGGHRLWLAPETAQTYVADNAPAEVTQLSEHSVVVTPAPEADSGIQKQIAIEMAPYDSTVTLTHRIKALRNLQTPVSAWALTVMKPGGVAVVPQHALGLHPDDLDDASNAADLDYQANRQLALWPYTHLGDTRFNWTSDSLRVSQQTGMKATKIGLQQTCGSTCYEVDGCRFTKTVPFVAGATYPDRGCNLEIFTNSEMLELETLSPLRQLKHDETLEHIETWTLDKFDQLS